MRPFYENFLFISIFLSLLCGIVTTLFKKGRTARVLTLLMLGICVLLHGSVFVNTALTGSSFTYAMGAFPAPWGNELRAGPVESLLAAVFSVVMILSLLGGEQDLEEDILPKKQNLYYIMVDLLAASLYALCYTNDIFTGYVFIEINTIAACSIVMARDSGQTIVATIRYLIMSMVGSGLFLFGTSMLYTITGHLLMPNLQAAVAGLPGDGSYAYPMAILVGLMLVGLCIKSALFPFHTWLPDAHGSATTASSAMLSGVVLKGYIILMIKILCRVFTLEGMRALGVEIILFVLGAAAMIYGSVLAVRENHVKRMIAYSSVSQVGYIFLGLGLCSAAGLTAALYQILAHAFTKSLLFLSAGALINASGHQKKLYYLHGAGRRCPAAGIGFTIGGLSMVGLPLLAGFITKLLVTGASIAPDIPQWARTIALLAIILSSLLNAWYYLPAIIQIWKGGKEPLGLHREVYADGPYDPGLSFRIAAAALGIIIVALGCAAQPLTELLTQSIALL